MEDDVSRHKLTGTRAVGFSTRSVTSIRLVKVDPFGDVAFGHTRSRNSRRATKSTAPMMSKALMGSPAEGALGTGMGAVA